MAKRYKNKYRIKSHRMPNWDYSGSGYYFITLVTRNRECNLGKIIDCEIILSDFGEIVDTEWKKSFEIRNELYLDQYIIMPNHLHAIIIIKNTNNNGISHESHESHESHVVETHGRASLRPGSFSRKPKSISSFIGGFKSAINSKIDDFIDNNKLYIQKYNRNNHFFQSNYYDHIIRDTGEYKRIKNYVTNNPVKWNNDKLNGYNGNIVMEPDAEYNFENWMV